jgi:hypothetical protein
VNNPPGRGWDVRAYQETACNAPWREPPHWPVLLSEPSHDPLPTTVITDLINRCITPPTPIPLPVCTPVRASPHPQGSLKSLLASLELMAVPTVPARNASPYADTNEGAPLLTQQIPVNYFPDTTGTYDPVWSGMGVDGGTITRVIHTTYLSLASLASEYSPDLITTSSPDSDTLLYVRTTYSDGPCGVAARLGHKGTWSTNQSLAGEHIMQDIAAVNAVGGALMSRPDTDPAGMRRNWHQLLVRAGQCDDSLDPDADPVSMDLALVDAGTKGAWSRACAEASIERCADRGRSLATIPVVRTVDARHGASPQWMDMGPVNASVLSRASTESWSQRMQVNGLIEWQGLYVWSTGQVPTRLSPTVVASDLVLMSFTPMEWCVDPHGLGTIPLIRHWVFVPSCRDVLDMIGQLLEMACTLRRGGSALCAVPWPEHACMGLVLVWIQRMFVNVTYFRGPDHSLGAEMCWMFAAGFQGSPEESVSARLGKPVAGTSCPGSGVVSDLVDVQACLSTALRTSDCDTDALLGDFASLCRGPVLGESMHPSCGGDAPLRAKQWVAAGGWERFGLMSVPDQCVRDMAVLGTSMRLNLMRLSATWLSSVKDQDCLPTDCPVSMEVITQVRSRYPVSIPPRTHADVSHCARMTRVRRRLYPAHQTTWPTRPSMSIIGQQWGEAVRRFVWPRKLLVLQTPMSVATGLEGGADDVARGHVDRSSTGAWTPSVLWSWLSTAPRGAEPGNMSVRTGWLLPNKGHLFIVTRHAGGSTYSRKLDMRIVNASPSHLWMECPFMLLPIHSTCLAWVPSGRGCSTSVLVIDVLHRMAIEASSRLDPTEWHRTLGERGDATTDYVRQCTAMGGCDRVSSALWTASLAMGPPSRAIDVLHRYVEAHTALSHKWVYVEAPHCTGAPVPDSTEEVKGPRTGILTTLYKGLASDGPSMQTTALSGRPPQSTSATPLSSEHTTIQSVNCSLVLPTDRLARTQRHDDYVLSGHGSIHISSSETPTIPADHRSLHQVRFEDHAPSITVTEVSSRLHSPSSSAMDRHPPTRLGGYTNCRTRVQKPLLPCTRSRRTRPASASSSLPSLPRPSRADMTSRAGKKQRCV